MSADFFDVPPSPVLERYPDLQAEIGEAAYDSPDAVRSVIDGLEANLAWGVQALCAGEDTSYIIGRVGDGLTDYETINADLLTAATIYGDLKEWIAACRRQLETEDC